MRQLFRALVLTVSIALGLTAVTVAFAEETTGEKIEAGAGEAKKDMKKSGRKAKKKIRKATGNESVTEDIKDGAANVGDEIDHQTSKAKNKVD